MLNLFCGYDAREAIGLHVFIESVIERASVPVATHVLGSRGMPVGSNEFTYSRFLVPWLMGYQGHAIFCDASDMLMLADVAELDALFDPQYAVQVVRHPNYTTSHPIKYVGTSMQCPNRNYARKNWMSVAIFNCEHPYWRAIEPATLKNCAGLSLLQLGGLKESEVGSLPDKWNRVVDEGHPVDGAALLHFTAGVPCFPHYRSTPGADLWFAQRDRMLEIA